VAILWMTGFGGSALFQEIYGKVSSEIGAIGPMHDYRPRPYDVQVMDKEHALPLTEDGKHLVARIGPGETSVLLDPHDVRRTPSGDKVFLTSDGTPVTRKRGVLVRLKTGAPYRPGSRARFGGRYRSRTVKLTLGGYLSRPVLNNDHTSEMDRAATAMFVMLRAYPLTFLMAILGTLSVILFFVTSSDSASMVADIIASGGSPNPTTGTRLFWGILEGVLAAVLLLAGGLRALQTGSITLGLPFCIIVILMCFSLLRGLRQEASGLIAKKRRDA